MKAKLIKILGGIALGVALLVLALPTIVHKAGLHPEYNGEAVQLPAGKRALIIATNQAVLSAPGETSWGCHRRDGLRDDPSLLQIPRCRYAG